MIKSFQIYDKQLDQLSNHCKLLITTINAHCFNLTKQDQLYREAIKSSDILIPDGISVVWAIRWLTGRRLKKIAGSDLFFYEMNRLQQNGGKCFFLGSNETTLEKIKVRIGVEYPAIEVQSYSPPYRAEFSRNENNDMVEAINKFKPDVLMIGMTAPKQEKWAYQHYTELQVGHICCIGAVFDFYAGTIRRAPDWVIRLGFEWLFRLIKEPRRMWKRYLAGNLIFIGNIFKEKFVK